MMWLIECCNAPVGGEACHIAPFRQVYQLAELGECGLGVHKDGLEILSFLYAELFRWGEYETLLKDLGKPRACSTPGRPLWPKQSERVQNDLCGVLLFRNVGPFGFQ